MRGYNKYENIIRLHINLLLDTYVIQDITLAILQNYVIEKLRRGNLVTYEPLASNIAYSLVSVLSSNCNDDSVNEYKRTKEALNGLGFPSSEEYTDYLEFIKIKAK